MGRGICQSQIQLSSFTSKALLGLYGLNRSCGFSIGIEMRSPLLSTLLACLPGFGVFAFNLIIQVAKC